MPDNDQSGQVSVESEGDVTVGGNVVGRDSITNTTHNTTTTTTTTITNITEAGPVARRVMYAAFGIAMLAILVLGVNVLRSNASTPTPLPPTPTLSAPSPSLPPTETPGATPQDMPTATSTTTLKPSSTLQPPTDMPAPTSFSTYTPTPLPPVILSPTPTPASAVPVYDDFNNNCLDADKWTLSAALAGPETPTPTPVPSSGNCLNARRQFFAEDIGRLNVFLDQGAAGEGEVEYQLTPIRAGCYKQVEVVLALDDMQPLPDAEVVNTFLSVGVDVVLARGSGNDVPARLEVQLGRDNVNGPLLTRITSLLTVPEGNEKYEATYSLGQVATISFRLVGGKLRAYIDDQLVAGGFAVAEDPCSLTIGFHADPHTLVDGYFEEVRLAPLP
jgi:hypothetical protein